MPKDIVKKIALYRYRFWLGYLALSFIFLGVLMLAMFYVPNGLSELERSSAVKSANLNFNDISQLFVINLPYHLLQGASIHLFGLSNLSIKLPSILISFASAVGLVFLLRSWFRPAACLIAAAIMLISTQYLYISQSGTAAIITVFWSVYIMLFAYLAVMKTGWIRYFFSAMLAATLALSLYTPLMIYVSIALAIGAFIHPHMRFVLRKRKNQLFAFILPASLLLTVPLGYFMFLHPRIANDLFVGTDISSVDWLHNILLVLAQLFDFPQLYRADILTPLFGLSIFILACVGIYSLTTRKHSVQNYVISAWSLMVIPLFILNPERSEIVFVPVTLLVATGISYTLWYWYRLFPRNPYARAAGLLPVMVLVGGILVASSIRYFYTYTYSPVQASKISSDLRIVERFTRDHTSPSILVVSKDEKPFYDVYVQSNDVSLVVTTDADAIYSKNYWGNEIIASRASSPVTQNKQSVRIIANDRSLTPSDRFYIYKNASR